MHDLLVRGGTVVTAETSERLDVVADGETIAGIGPPGSFGPTAKRVVDADGCLVVPGGVDPHVHYGLTFGPVTSESQEWSAAAALGGTTTVIDFALQEAPATLHQAIAAKRAEADGAIAVDYGLHAIVAGPDIAFEVIDELGDVVRDGVPTIKTFMTYGWMVDDGARFGIMSAVAEHGGMSVVHAEDDALAAFLAKKYLREGKTHGAHIAETRGPLVEEAAVRRAMLLAERSGSALYVLHMAAGSAVAALAEGRERALPFYGETLLLYLSFTADALWDDDRRGLLWNNYPPIKEKEDQDALWAALADDRLQAVGTDHFAVTSEERFELMGTTVDQLQAGIASVELRVPVLFHLGVHEGRLSVNRFVEVSATNPAKLMGLYPRKGTIAIGSDADLAVIDPARTWTVRAGDLYTRADYSCWDGWEVHGKVTATVLRGAVVAEDGAFVGRRDGGRFLPRCLPREILAGAADLSATNVAPALVVEPVR
ncbi:MAG: amidohydrolase family protein [Actinomycetota bacterium]|nr:amidohydrolase family protein [Actinomycetota bacterium]